MMGGIGGWLMMVGVLCVVCRLCFKCLFLMCSWKIEGSVDSRLVSSFMVKNVRLIRISGVCYV